MSILVDRRTKVLVQGITGLQASFHVKRALACGTNVVAGVSPQNGGTTHLGIPVFDTVAQAVKETGASASILFVPAAAVKSAVREAVESELATVVTIAYGVPVHDMIEIKAMLKGSKTLLIGPNTPGVITPEQACLGIFPENIHRVGEIGILSRSSTLTYEAVLETSRHGRGQSTVIGLGDDMVVGTGFVPLLERFEADNATKAIVLLGKLGGTYEEEAADYYASLKQRKPVIAYIAGSSVSWDHRFGYAGDLITHGRITVQDKKDALSRAGMIVVDQINQIHQVLDGALR
jgi:succinyl-CoA synthetase alpha subunit